MRTAFNKNGGSLGASGCVAFLFERKGYIAIDRTERQIEEDELMLDVIAAGGEELRTEDEYFEVLSAPERYEKVKAALEADYPVDSAEVTMIPKTYADADGEGVEKLEKLIDALEDDDDVQAVYTNYQ